MKYLFLTILLSCVGCSASQQNNSNFEIKGKWRFESHEIINRFEDVSFSEDGQGSLFMFFGGEILMNCIGKEIEFLDKGKITTSLVDQESLDAMNFRYSIQLEDSLIVFSVTNEDGGSINNMPVKFTVQGDKMIWEIDHFIELSLTRSDY